MNIYVANLNYKVQDEHLRELFEEYGEVSSAKVISDRETGQSRGFGFVEMPDENDGLTAIEELDGAEVQGRAIKVNKARPKTEGGNGGGGGGRRFSNQRY
ncbi:RNA recognition motif domain-containing protein [Catalinimonas niigatensis]|uniref:RNA recognition motif domain-containing protein n=1 Tax=Catalinimonas niigatensis TaxID=1397264 RepID=UPI002664EC65|nr:RNA-binding protein [Catalinimonas niigatensis]WPP51734.1 RNA-binding protein [Catalinimonas niigatensis]